MLLENERASKNAVERSEQEWSSIKRALGAIEHGV